MCVKWGVSLTLEGRVYPELSAAECSGGGTDEGEGHASQHTVSGGLVPAVGCLKGSGECQLRHGHVSVQPLTVTCCVCLCACMHSDNTARALHMYVCMYVCT